MRLKKKKKEKKIAKMKLKSSKMKRQGESKMDDIKTKSKVQKRPIIMQKTIIFDIPRAKQLDERDANFLQQG